MVTFLLVAGFLALAFIQSQHRAVLAEITDYSALAPIAAALALIGGMSALLYMVVSLPFYCFGWWRGLGDQVAHCQ